MCCVGHQASLLPFLSHLWLTGSKCTPLMASEGGGGGKGPWSSILEMSWKLLLPLPPVLAAVVVAALLLVVLGTLRKGEDELPSRAAAQQGPEG